MPAIMITGLSTFLGQGMSAVATVRQISDGRYVSIETAWLILFVIDLSNLPRMLVFHKHRVLSLLVNVLPEGGGHFRLQRKHGVDRSLPDLVLVEGLRNFPM